MIEVDYRKIVSDAGIPTEQAAMETAWKAEMAAQQSAISNDNQYSPFWRIVTALITKPALWLVDLISGTVLPNAFLKDAAGIFLDLLAYGVDLERKPAGKAKGNLTFTRANPSNPITILTGTIVETVPINGVVYRLITDADTDFQGSDPTVLVAATAEQEGSAYNLGDGYYALPQTPLAGITAVSNESGWLATPGADVENDMLLRARVRNQFNTASNYHTDAVYKSLIGLFPGVDVDAIWFEHDAPRGPGTANAFVLFDFSAPAEDYLVTINQYITDQGNHGHGDDLIVFQMPEQTIDLVCDIWHVQNLSAGEISALESAITDFINAAFRENQSYTPILTYPFDRFSFSRLGQELHEQFDQIDSVDFDLTDILSALWIPRIDTLQVNMNETE